MKETTKVVQLKKKQKLLSVTLFRFCFKLKAQTFIYYRGYLKCWYAGYNDYFSCAIADLGGKIFLLKEIKRTFMFLVSLHDIMTEFSFDPRFASHLEFPLRE